MLYPAICFLEETHLSGKSTHMWHIKWWKQSYKENGGATPSWYSSADICYIRIWKMLNQKEMSHQSIQQLQIHLHQTLELHFKKQTWIYPGRPCWLEVATTMACQNSPNLKTWRIPFLIPLPSERNPALYLDLFGDCLGPEAWPISIWLLRQFPAEASILLSKWRFDTVLGDFW